MASDNKLSSLSKDDLFLLMESYRNMIQMYTTLSEQQRQIMESEKVIIQKIDALVTKQIMTCDKLDHIVDVFETYVKTVIELNKKSLESIDEVKTSIESLKIENIKSHSSLTNKIYIALIGSVTIIATLLNIIF